MRCGPNDTRLIESETVIHETGWISLGLTGQDRESAVWVKYSACFFFKVALCVFFSVWIIMLGDNRCKKGRVVYLFSSNVGWPDEWRCILHLLPGLECYGASSGHRVCDLREPCRPRQWHTLFVACIRGSSEGIGSSDEASSLEVDYGPESSGNRRMFLARMLPVLRYRCAGTKW